MVAESHSRSRFNFYHQIGQLFSRLPGILGSRVGPVLALRIAVVKGRKNLRQALV